MKTFLAAVRRRAPDGKSAEVLARAQAALSQRPTLLFAIVGLVLPNVLFFGAILSGIGTPVRTTSIVSYFLAVMIARVFSARAGVLAFTAVLAYDIINTVALLFNLSFLNIVTVIEFVDEIDLFASPLYALASIFLVVTSGATLWLLITARDSLMRARLAPVALATFALAGTDYFVNNSAHYSFGAALAYTHPFESASRESGFEAAVMAETKPNVLLVLVEGMGVLADPRQQALMISPLTDIALRERFEVTTGQTTYFGSTTAAEMRELCASREGYEALFEESDPGDDPECLPSKLDSRGYHTTGIHGFGKNMFDRHLWWPNMGLEDTLFGEDLVRGLPMCGRVFRGICDLAIVETIEERLRDRSQPQFVYWLTLNTHIPVIPDEHRGTIPCASNDVFGPTTVCHMVNMWHDVFADIARIALEKDLPPTEILIVGDHAPPLWSRRDRALFEPGLVTWARLAWKGSAGGNPAQVSRDPSPGEVRTGAVVGRPAATR